MTTTTNTTDTTIVYPTADELDTGGISDYTVDLYLIPAEENNGQIAVDYHAGRGNIGTPMAAWHRRWLHIGHYGGQAIGESVLAVLQEMEALLIERASQYQGTEWNGSNYVGSWAQDEYGSHLLDGEWERYAEDIRHYWDAEDYFGPAQIGWVELCAEAQIDPERALGADWRMVAQEVAKIVESLQDEQVSGTDDYALRVAEEWRDEHSRCECGAVTGEPCSREQEIVVDWMPVSLRASHEHAGNRGYYPHNGSLRLAVSSECGENIIETSDGWAMEVSDD